MTENDKNYYDNKIVRDFAFATLFWGIIAFTVGLLAALQLSYWKFNFDLEWLTFGRIRPLHTNAAIFAFAGNAIFAGIYHSTQRLCRVRMFSDVLSRIHFWGWQAIIVGAAITLPLGFTQSKEYAELEWPLDISIALIWVIFGLNFFMTLKNRKEKHIYVALWFYIATIITVAVLHIFNSIEIPVSMLNSYPVYAGIQDAMVQWWYGHNAVAFFLTTPFLGLMYYYIPKAAERPVYSYKLSIIHFWALIFIYIWAGPHHLLNTSLPDWAQTLGMVFSVMLWAPSWGGMINGLLTLRGAWHLLRTSPVIKFLVTAVTFYGMATFEGPLLSIKSVSSLAHYTDWIVAHVHGGALGWNGFLTFGMLYYMIPKLYNTKLYSEKLANIHFWVGLLGILLYYISMTVAGITQGLMWRAINDQGKLVYPDFVETVTRIVPLYYVRAAGGVLFIIGTVLMIYNMVCTIRNSKGLADDPVAEPLEKRESTGEHKSSGHRRLEGAVLTFSVLSFVAIAVGSVIEIVPTLSLHKYVDEKVQAEPYTPLELAGRDIYVREGCYTCHSQQIRTLPFDVLRFGPASSVAESMYDRPFQWGSKRIGPDLARVGKKYPHIWHYRHMRDPREVISDSLMPSYPWLLNKKTDFYSLRRKLSVMKYLGVPYDQDTVANADIVAEKQARELSYELREQGITASALEQKEIVALIAYLQALGQKVTPIDSVASEGEQK
ncbi:MAG: cytochrome-c oxidase, cbb3-type subunit I [Bdellovibrionaceae bacterium]|nr:cytochrome-c oxidase, cbb3-type subunit I [Pseudobdellovibrionaceae bacterium]